MIKSLKDWLRNVAGNKSASTPIRKLRRSFRPVVEHLESRELLSVTSWTNSSGGSWNDAGNWSAGVPTSSDDAVINLTGNYTVNLSSGTSSVNSLTLAKSLVINGGSLTSTQAIQVTGALSLESGSLTSTNGVTIDGGAFSFSGGSLSGTVTLHDSDLTVDGATGSASFIINGDCTFTGDVASGQTILVKGGVNSEHATLSVSDGSTNDGTIRLESVNSSTARSDLALEGTMVNTGTIESRVGSGGWRFIIGGEFDNQGTLDIGASHYLNFISGTDAPDLIQTDGSVYAPNTGSGVVVSGGSFQYIGGSITGQFVVINGSVDVDDTVTATATIQVRGTSSTLVDNEGEDVTLHVQGTSWDGHAKMTAANGAVNVGTILLEPLHTNYNSDLALSGTLTNTGTIKSRVGAGGWRFVRGGTLDNQGTIDVGSGHYLNFIANGSSIPHLVQTSGSVYAPNTNSGVVVTAGTFDFVGGAVDGQLVAINSTVDIADTVTDTATIEVRGTTSTLTGNEGDNVTIWVQGTSWDGNALLTVSNGAQNTGTILLQPMHSSTIQSNMALAGSFTNAGTINSRVGSGGWRQILGGTLVNQGVIDIGSGHYLNLESGLHLVQQSGSIAHVSGSGVVYGGGEFDFVGGSIGGAGEFVTINTNIEVESTVSTTATVKIRGSSATIVKNASTSVTLWVQGTVWDGHAVATINNGAINAGTILLEPLHSPKNSNLSLTGTFTNTGTINSRVGSGGWRQILGGTLVNQGTIDIGSGHYLNFESTPHLVQESGTISHLAGSGVVFAAGAFDFVGGTISGAGEFVTINTTIDVQSTVTTSATVKVRGPNSVVLDNASTAVTLWVQGTTWDGHAVATISNGAVNAGTILLEPIFSGKNSNLILAGVFTNEGTINSRVGTGGWRQILGGTLVNEGAISVGFSHFLNFASNGVNSPYLIQESGTFTHVSGSGVVFFGGRVDYNGGAISGAGDFVVIDTIIDVESSVSNSTTLLVRGLSNTLVKNASPFVTLWVQGTNEDHEAGLGASSGAVNAGTIKLASAGSAQWGQKFFARNSLANNGTFSVDPGTGGPSNYDGDLINVGTVHVSDGAILQMNSIDDIDPTFVNNGTIDADGPLVQDGGSFTFNGGSISGDFYVNGTSINITDDAATASTINAAGQGNEIIDNSSSNVTVDEVDEDAPGHENGPGYIHVSVNPQQTLVGETVNYFVSFEIESDPPGAEMGATALVTLHFGDGDIFHYTTNKRSGSFTASHEFSLVASGTVYKAYAVVAWTDPDVYSEEVPITIIDGPAQAGPPAGPFPQNGTDCMTLVPLLQGKVPNPSTTTPNPVRYFDGTIAYEVTDLASSGFGTAWGQTRSWTNSDVYVADSMNGFGTVDGRLPHLANVSANSIAVVQNGITANNFDYFGGGYVERFGGKMTLRYDASNGIFTLIDVSGSRYLFNDFDTGLPVAARGRLLSLSDASGNLVTVNRNTDGTISEVVRTDDMSDVEESFLYAYISGTDPNTGRLESVTLRRRIGTGSWDVVRSVVYSYYDGIVSHGNLGDLKLAEVRDEANNPIDAYYYRYYVASEANGYQHALKFAVHSDSFARLDAAVSDPFLASNTEVAVYADYYFEYDAQHRATKEIVQGAGCSTCTGGMGTYTYSYTTSSNTTGVNKWKVKFVETMPDGNQNIVYTNGYGSVMLKSFKNVSTGQEWVEFYQYDNEGRVVLSADPEAVSGYNDTYADLMHWTGSGYQYVRDAQGIITRYVYSTRTTATRMSPGDVIGYLQNTSIQHGETGNIQIQEAVRYFHRSVAGKTVSPIASQTVFPDPSNPNSFRTTNYAYTWLPGTTHVESIAVSQPIVLTTQNGSGLTETTTTFLDHFGRPVWTQDADGYLQYMEYDVATGALTKSITDVDTSLTSDFAYLPEGWETPANGGMHLITSREVDGLGRTTKLVDSNGNVDYYVFNDVAHEVRTYAGWDDSTDRPIGPTTVVRRDQSLGYVEVLTMSATPAVSGGRPTGAESIDDLETLSRVYSNSAGQQVTADAYFSLVGLSYTTSTAFGTEGTHFDRTEMSYDNRGWHNRTVTPNGTITRTVYNGFGLPVSEWIGTNDTPVSGFWSPSNPAGMVKTRDYIYDDGGVGNHLLTSRIEYPGGGAAARVTEMYYDWRNRLVAIKSGVETSEDTDTNRPISYLEYNNLGEVVAREFYDGDDVSIMDSNTDGVPDKPDAELLRARSTFEFDAQGRTFRTSVHSVNPDSGAISSNALKTNFWFDHRGNLVKTSSPGGLITKSKFDGAGRPFAQFSTDGGGDSDWDDALDVSGDIVLEQVEYEFDANGSIIQATQRHRFHDATGTGALGTPTTGIAARVYYSGMYYDELDRLTASVEVGTNGGSAWARPSTVPTRSDTVLVTTMTYNSAGWVDEATDPRGIVNHNDYDNLGRTIRAISAFTNGTPTSNTNKTTEYTYVGGHMTSLTAVLPSSGQQETAFLFGVSVSGGSTINSNDIQSEVRRPDPSTGAASASEAETFTVNALGQMLTATDRNGTTHTYTYDVLGRLVMDAVSTLGAGVDGSVRRIEFAYNGQGNVSLVTTFDASSGGDVVNQIQRIYNGLGQLTTEYQSHAGEVDTGTTPSIEYAYREMAGGANDSRIVSMTYPNGRVLNYNYSSGLNSNISRLSSISDTSGTLEEYTYLGLETVIERLHSETGVDLTYIKQGSESNGDAGDPYNGLDRFGRVVDQRWIDGSGAATDRFLYGYDRDGNVLFKQNPLNSAMSELYHANGASNGYDSLNQLTAFARGVLSDTNSDNVPDTISSPSHSQDWTFDAMGNWSSVTTDSVTQNRTTNAQNEVTGVDSNTLTYDDNGNMTTDETGRDLTFDAWNRLIEVADGSTTVALYAYDGKGRRVTETHGSDVSELYYSDEWQLLEERNGDDETNVQYVWSPVYVDAMILRDRDTDANGSLEERLYVQQDANWNVTALVSTSGSVVTRFAYDPYGAAIFLTPNWAGPASTYGWKYLHQGGRFDEDTGLYAFRHRDFSPTLGRWIENDPIRFNAGDANFYRYVDGSPVGLTDPSGLSPYGFADDLKTGFGVLQCWGMQLINNPAVGRELDYIQQFFGAIADRVTGGLTTRWNEYLWGETATRNHKGPMWEYGKVVGDVLSLMLSFVNPCGLAGLYQVAIRGITAMEMIGGVLNAYNNYQAGNYGAAILDAVGVLGNALNLARVCFTGDTPIITKRGSIRFDELEVGDEVLSAPEDDPRAIPAFRRVEQIFRNYMPIWHVHVKGQVIRTTAEHPFYVWGRGWISACNLRIGDMLRSHDGRFVVVDDVCDGGYQEAVYNCRINEYHTYFISGADWGFSVWAHNLCNLHHPIPKVIGGDKKQFLVGLDRALEHMPFHKAYQAALNAAKIPINTLGGMSRAEVLAEFLANKGLQRKAFDVLIATARDFDAKNGTRILDFVKHNIRRFNFDMINW